MAKLKVLMVSSEIEPFAKTGGLGDVLGALPQALNETGNVDCRCIMPLYSLINDNYRKKMKYLGYIYVDLNWRHQYCGVYSLKKNNVTYYFIDNEFYYKKNKLYDDNDLERFSFLDLASFEVCKFLNFKPNVIHAHDWQTGAIPLLLEAKYRHEAFFKNTKSVFTIHNLQYQGKFYKGHVSDMLPIDPAYYGNEDTISFLKLGIIYSYAVTTVSPNYAEEIKTPEYGEGLDGLLNFYKFKLTGILNGIDYNTYSCENDSLIAKKFERNDYIDGKKANKEALLEKLGFSRSNNMLIGIVTRLASQKGIDLILNSFDRIMQNDVTVVLLGSGAKEYENAFNELACRYPSKFRAILKFDNQMAHEIYAASDLFFMPSAFEPCGLAQMICLSYGTLPLVRECGGLKDSIIPFNEFDMTGNGFSFKNYDANDFYNVFMYAYSVYQEPKKWNKIIENGLKCDFSWGSSALKYTSIYNEVIHYD